MILRKRPVTPRQKLINLMYIILMALLALNISKDVLDGFSLMEEGLGRTASGTARENQVLYEDFEQKMQVHPAKTREWYEKAQEVRRISDSLYIFAEQLKMQIAKEADGAKADVHHLINKENQEATMQVMLAPGRGKGEELYTAINAYRRKMTGLMEDNIKRRIVEENLSTAVPENAEGQNWTEYMFSSMPAAAAVALLTKLQSDICYAEGEVLHTLMDKVDEKDIRVNALSAFVIPEERHIVSGNKFRANIVMAAIDTTQLPEVYIDGIKDNLKDGWYERVCRVPGEYDLKGWLEVSGNDGSKLRKPFSQRYIVSEPTATVSADLMNVLYAGYDNPISISIPGVPLTAVQASMDNGSLTQTAAGRFCARPAISAVGKKAVITVFADRNQEKQQMAECVFQVRKLPQPAAYLKLKDEKGNAEIFHGGSELKTRLLTAEKVLAAVDDGILNVPFKVKSFEMVFFDNMGNAIPYAAADENITPRQNEAIRKLSHGKRFYISRILAAGPDGTERVLDTPIEIIVR